MDSNLNSRINKGIKAPFIIKIFILIGLTLLGILLAVIISIPFMTTKSTTSLWLVQAFSALLTFLIPAIIYGHLSEKNLISYFNLHPIHLKDFIWAIIILIALQPLISLLGIWNQNITFPESLNGLEKLFKEMENNSGEMIESMLNNRSWWAIGINFIVIAVLAGITEEFFFRGAILNIFREKFKNPHFIIWMVAIIFSAIHLQFYGFFPRIILGALMGYLLYWTGNLWIPVIIHTTNNALAVFTWNGSENLDSTLYDSIPKIISITLVIGGMAIAYFAAVKLQQNHISRKVPNENQNQ